MGKKTLAKLEEELSEEISELDGSVETLFHELGVLEDRIDELKEENMASWAWHTLLTIWLIILSVIVVFKVF